MLAALFLARSLLQGWQPPVLEFPEAGLDDPAAYAGYTTRFFRDARRNAFQISLDRRSGRVVHLWADASNASAGFTVRDTLGRPAAVTWDGPGADARQEGRLRSMVHHLASEPTALEIGWFVLGTMRQERDFQYAEWHRRPFGGPEFVLAELANLIRSLERLPPGERARHLAPLSARDVAELRSRLEPRITVTHRDGSWVARVEHVGLDGRNQLTLELRGDGRASTARLVGRVLSVRSRSGAGLRLEVTATTDAPVLTPLDRSRIFNPAFEAFLARERRRADSLGVALPADALAGDTRLAAFRRLDREVRALELLSYEEKILASMPNYATYFGRDMLMTALMLEPIASVDLEERVIASVLEKLDPSGDVSHEEALGGQAIRENAAEYAALIRAWEEGRRRDPAAAARSLERAREVLGDLQAVRENYRMIDDDFQLPVLAARYLARDGVPADRKRRFLSEVGLGGMTRLDALIRNLALVTERAARYAGEPTAANLVGFLHRDDRGWLPGSWRDSRAGYGNGRFAMDVNTVWVPQALEATATIVGAVADLALPLADAVARVPGGAAALTAHLRDPQSLASAIATWRRARRHFEVALDPDTVRLRLLEWLESLPGPERDHWRRVVDAGDLAGRRPLSFLALSLDSLGRPIPAVNTDPATALFLGDATEQILRGAADPAAVEEMLDPFTRPYPLGLLIAGLGPVVVNDAFAPVEVRRRFREDTYQSPRVVWGREVNLLFLGLARQIAAAYHPSGRLRSESASFRSYVSALRRTLEVTRSAVDASGLRHNELWSYAIDGGRLRPARYGTSSDIQLWNVTDLAVRYLLDGLPPP
jgi:hypothetical protein